MTTLLTGGAARAMREELLPLPKEVAMCRAGRGLRRATRANSASACTFILRRQLDEKTDHDIREFFE
jgi:hypothetical protein